MRDDFREPEGFSIDYIGEGWDRDSLIASGFIPKGNKVRLRTFNAGYEYERKEIHELNLEIGDIFTITESSVGRSSSSYKFLELPGSFNTVFFEPVDDNS